MPETSRETIDRFIEEGDATQARVALVRLWSESSTPSVAGFIVSRFEQLQARLAFTSCRVAMLRSFTVEPMVPLLRAGAFCAGISLDVRVGQFNTWSQEILDAGSWLYQFSPDVVILAVQTRRGFPYRNFGMPSPIFAPWRMCRLPSIERSLISHSFCRCSDRGATHISILHLLEMPADPTQGLRQMRASSGTSRAAAGKINAGLRDLLRAAEYICSTTIRSSPAEAALSGMMRGNGGSRACPLPRGNDLPRLREWLRFLHPITGKVCKVLAVDLDNTIWGGIIGEDGINAIQLGEDYPGCAYRALQRAILDLYRRGIILAICSKNNSADAIEAIEKHPGMLLRMKHFAAVRINWNDKATNLREIATELNVGIDSVAFLDDNPVEREWIRGQIPEACVIELPSSRQAQGRPADPMKFAEVAAQLPAIRASGTDGWKTRKRKGDSMPSSRSGRNCGSTRRRWKISIAPRDAGENRAGPCNHVGASRPAHAEDQSIYPDHRPLHGRRAFSEILADSNCQGVHHRDHRPLRRQWHRRSR